MKISCPTCSAKYSIADEKVQNRLAKIRCRKCGTSIVIDGNVSPAKVYAADSGAPAVPSAEPVPAAAPQGPAAPEPAAAPEQPAAPQAEATEASQGGATYTVDLGENDQRPMTVDELVEAYNTGVVTAETYVWTDGFADWATLGQVEEIVEALHAAAQRDAAQHDAPTAPLDEASAVGASTQPDESPWDTQPSAELEMPVATAPATPAVPAAPAMPAAPAAAPRVGGADLFGSVSDAGGESDSNDEDQLAASPLAGSRAPSTTGSRNESSVLFSLSALTSGASNSRPSVPAPSSPSTTNEDSGLIDLKALTASAQATAGAPGAPAPYAPMPLATPSPLGAAAPLGGAVGATAPPAASGKNNTGLYIAVGIVVAAVAVASIMTFGGSDEQPVAPPAPAESAAAAAPEPAPVPVAAPAPLPTAEAKPPSTGTEEEEEAPQKPAPVAPKPRPKTSTPKPGPKPAPQVSPAPSPAPKPAPAPSAGKCGCAKDDLMCLMNCAQ